MSPLILKWIWKKSKVHRAGDSATVRWTLLYSCPVWRFSCFSTTYIILLTDIYQGLRIALYLLAWVCDWHWKLINWFESNQKNLMFGFLKSNWIGYLVGLGLEKHTFFFKGKPDDPLCIYMVYYRIIAESIHSTLSHVWFITVL